MSPLQQLIVVVGVPMVLMVALIAWLELPRWMYAVFSGRGSMNNEIAIGDGWINREVKVNADEQCPIHGPQETIVGNCWPCHVAGCMAAPESCEPIDE